MGSSQMQGELWGAAPQDWATEQEGTCRPLWYDALRAVRVGPGTELLVAGCGSGGASLEAICMGATVTGLDASAPLLAVARHCMPSVRFEQGDLESMPFPDGAFDAVIAINSVMYASDMANAMKEIARVRRPGGRVAVASWGSPEDCEMRDIFGAMIGALPQKPPGGGRSPSPRPGRSTR